MKPKSTHPSTYRRNLRILRLQSSLTSTPESIKEISERLGIYITLTGTFLSMLRKENGCKMVKSEIKDNGKRNKLYFVDGTETKFDVGEPPKMSIENRDAWKPSPKPTDDVRINALMGYTDHVPQNAIYIDESHASWSGRKMQYGIGAVSAQMMEMAA